MIISVACCEHAKSTGTSYDRAAEHPVPETTLAIKGVRHGVLCLPCGVVAMKGRNQANPNRSRRSIARQQTYHGLNMSRTHFHCCAWSRPETEPLFGRIHGRVNEKVWPRWE